MALKRLRLAETQPVVGDPVGDPDLWAKGVTKCEQMLGGLDSRRVPRQTRRSGNQPNTPKLFGEITYYSTNALAQLVPRQDNTPMQDSEEASNARLACADEKVCWLTRTDHGYLADFISSWTKLARQAMSNATSRAWFRQPACLIPGLICSSII